MGRTRSTRSRAAYTGNFPVAGAQTNPITIARYILTELLSLSSYVDTADFTTAAAAYPYTGGVYIPEPVDALTVIDQLLASAGAKLYPQATDGKLSVFVLRALTGSETPAVMLDSSNVIRLTPVQLPSTLDPPPYRIRVGYDYNYTRQGAGLSSSATTTWVQYVATEQSFAAASSATVLSSYRRPNDPPPIRTALTKQADAATVATALMALWGTRRRIYSVECIASEVLSVDLSSVVSLTWAADDLRSGKIGRVVGIQYISTSDVITLEVLI